MPNVEIDEEELRRLHTLRNTVAAVAKNPIAKLKLQEATKIAFPEAVTPDLDDKVAQYKAEKELRDEIAALRKEVTDEREKRDTDAKLDKFASDHATGLKKLRDQGYTDAGIEAIDKLMKEKGITDHDIAVAYYDRM